MSKDEIQTEAPHTDRADMVDAVPADAATETSANFTFATDGSGVPPTPPDLASEFIAGTPRSGTEGKMGGKTEGETEPAAVASIEAALKEVFDPEIPVNIYDLGLIYEIKPNGRGFEILMTLTAPACPVAGILPQQVADAAAGVAGAGQVVVRLTWEPPWDWSRMSDDARIALGFTD